jgi:hypothetical protein
VAPRAGRAQAGGGHVTIGRARFFGGKSQLTKYEIKPLGNRFQIVKTTDTYVELLAGSFLTEVNAEQWLVRHLKMTNPAALELWQRERQALLPNLSESSCVASSPIGPNCSGSTV